MTTARGRAFADRFGAPLPDDYVCAQCSMRFSAGAFEHFQSHVRDHEVRTMATPRTTQKRTRSAPATPPPFLTADDLAGRARFRILPSITIYHGDRGTSIFLGVENEAREPFTWSVKAASPDRISLQQLHGRNMINWPGKMIELEPVNGTQGGRFVNLHDPTRAQRTSAPSRTTRTPTNAKDNIPF